MPRVSVITPNYNHARYLHRRLESISRQTFRDFELIILDNASTDSSREVIESFTGDPRVRAIFNRRNNGSTFRQWNLGLSHARGDYVWFAESDDYADPSLLETLVDRLDRHPSVGLACCQSWVVDERDRILRNHKELQTIYDDRLRHHPDYDPGHWDRDYINDGRHECLVYLFHLNTIPNASAVLLRRSLLERIGGAPTDMLICGDWLTYARVLMMSDIAFVSTPLNYFRQHQGTVRSKLSRGTRSIRESRLVQKFLIENYDEPDLRAEHRLALRGWVGFVIQQARRAPYGKVPTRDAMELLRWFARHEPACLKVALPMLAREWAADVARRAGVLGVFRQVGRIQTPGRHE